jgi:predicted ATPase
MVRVCWKLDGIPLAIELATARMGALAVEQVAQRLDVSLDVLSGANRMSAPRQQTLRATIDWSHKLLSEAERTLFRWLSVFAGGWTLETAEGVCSGGGVEENDVLDLLRGLVDKSLVAAGAPTGGAVRYRMLEPLRQYAREKLEEGGKPTRCRTVTPPSSSPWPKKPNRSSPDRSRAYGWSAWKGSTTTSGRLSHGPSSGRPNWRCA